MADEHKESLLTQHQDQDTKKEAEDLQRDCRFDGMGKIQIWAYGVGHFINDLVAACWFNYLFYFLSKVVHTLTGPLAILTGQIVDGIMTPIVGILSDKTNTSIGQRKPWYIGGLVLVVLAFIPIFGGFKFESTAGEYAFYTIFPGLFNVGWASLQISHMSLVPSLTCSRKRRDKLNNLRNLFTFISNFTVLGIGLIVFSTMSNKKLQYKLVAYISLFIGFCASIFFIKNIKEPQLVAICHEKQQKLKAIVQEQKAFDKKIVGTISDVSYESDDDCNKIEPLKKRQSKKDWFKMPKFYLFGICYMCVRMYTNLFGSFLPFYLTDVVNMGVQDENAVSFNLALVPMLAYMASVAISTQLNKFYEYFGRKKALFVGTAICLGCLVVMAFLKPKYNWVMYILAFFIGASQSLVLSTGINFISDVVGSKGKTGAFVFGIYSLLDKFACGIVIYVVGKTSSFNKQTEDITDQDRNFIRLIMVLVPGVACLVSSLIVLSYPIEEYSKKSKKDEFLKQKSQLQEELVH